MDTKLITSTANPRIKTLLNLRKRAFRNESNLMLIEGVREVSLAWENNINLKEIYYCKNSKAKDLLSQAQDRGILLFELSSPVFSKVAFGDRSEGIIALGEKPGKDLKTIELSENPILVVVESLEKPGNLGAVIRSADSAGVDAVIVCQPKTDIYNPNVIRASIGTCFSLNLVEASKRDTIAWLKKQHIKIIAAVPDSSRCYWEVDFKSPCAIVLGCEDKGLSSEFKSASDLKINIPMKGQADSLNVSTSAAIILYEAVRQRNFKGAH